jgi:hypothetical protein
MLTAVLSDSQQKALGLLAEPVRDSGFYWIIAHSTRLLTECLQLFQRKFASVHTDVYHLMKSLIYFDDAEGEQTPEMIKPVRWDEVKEYFRKEVDKLVARREAG